MDENWELEQRWTFLVGRQSEVPLDRPGVEEENGLGWGEGTGIFKILALPKFDNENREKGNNW